uniref:Uncharacterized protein n=1 Tax=Knipowitschia caucasica TaxID=637954 RepID=A0AAV2J8U4_KNICA
METLPNTAHFHRVHSAFALKETALREEAAVPGAACNHGSAHGVKEQRPPHELFPPCCVATSSLTRS